MKRTGYIYEKICTYENVETAVMKASLGKRNRNYVKMRLTHLDETVLKIQKLLIEQIYVPSPYTVKKIQDGPSQKERIIFKPRFYPDQIIHWALMLQLQAVITKGMYEYTCGSVPGR